MADEVKSEVKRSPAIAVMLAALFDHSPDSLRRMGAAVAAALLPFANAACQAKLGFSAPDAQVLAAEGVLSLYITQSFLKAYKTADLVPPPAEEQKQ